LKQGFDAAKTQTSSWASNLGSMAKTALTGVVVGAAVAAAGAVISIGAAAMDVSVQTQQASADIAASLGLPIEEARKFGEVAKQVYGDNFADSVTDAGDAVAIVAKQLQLAAEDPALKTMTENAFRLRDVFGVDVSESVDAVKTLMTNFGISSEEAFDLLASGYQKGLDRSGDFLDTVGEYSVQFAAGGASAGEFFSLLDSGLQGGMLGTDKAADAFKEFRVRIADGSKTTADALAQIGINVDDLTAQMASGTISAADAFGIVQAALNATEDPVVRMQAGVGLMGTQFEDLGDKTALALSMTQDWAAGSAGAITSLDTKYATFGSAVEGIWRRLVVSVSPFTDKVLELVNDAMPSVMAAFDTFDAAITPILLGVIATIGMLITEFQKFVDQPIAYLKDHLPEWTTALGSWAEAAWSWITDTALPTALAKLTEWGTGLAGWVTANAPVWATSLVTFATATWTWLTGTVIPEVGTKLGKWWTALSGWVTANAPIWATSLGAFATATWSWLTGEGGVVSQVPKKLGEWWTAIKKWLDETLPKLETQLEPWTAALAEWVKNATPKTITSLNDWHKSINEWFATELANFLVNLVKWTTALVEWIGKAIPGAIIGIADFVNSLVAWMTGTGAEKGVGKLNTGLGSWTQRFVDWVAELITRLVPEWAKLGAAIVKALGDIGTAIDTAKATLVTSLFNVGVAIGQGLVNGMVQAVTGGVGALGAAVSSAAQSALTTAKAALGIQSPSKRARIEVGRPFMQGIGAGMEDELPMLAQRMRANMNALIGGINVMGGSGSVTNHYSFPITLQGTGNAAADLLSTVQTMNMHYRTA